jgi:thiol-disulfide isomerase/thioredoxin
MPSSRFSLRQKLTSNNLFIIGGIILLLVAIIVIPTVVIKTKEGFEMEEPNLTPNDDEIVVGLFWADWCPHCVRFKPTFEKVASDLSGTETKKSKKKLRFEKVDCVALAPLAKKYGVQGYPTIKIIRSDKDMDEYEGSREENEFAKYLSTL